MFDFNPEFHINKAYCPTCNSKGMYTKCLRVNKIKTKFFNPKYAALSVFLIMLKVTTTTYLLKPQIYSLILFLPSSLKPIHHQILSRQKINKETVALKYTLEQMD